MADLAEGDRAPAFTLEDDAGEKVALADFRGQPVVLTFYAEDDTPVCSVQVCEFRDSLDGFEGLDAVVLAVSPDPVDAHAKWRRKLKLPFALLSDPDRKVMRAYGAWGRKIMYGREVEGVIRSTFVIDGAGRIARVFRNIRTEGHARRVLEAMRG